jgi:hypothetical protein
MSTSKVVAMAVALRQRRPRLRTSPFAVFFDDTKTIEVTGSVTEFRFQSTPSFRST